MDKARKQRLENMLRAVQELKGEYYIGTQRAFNAIKAIARVYDCPGIIASTINEKANIGLEGFLATPERLNGIGLLIGHLQEEFQNELDVIEDGDTLYRELLARPSINLAQILLTSGQGDIYDYSDWLFGWPLFEQSESEKTEQERYADKLFKYNSGLFAEINQAGIRTDEELGKFVSLRLYEELNKMALSFDAESAKKLLGEYASEIEPDETVLQNFPLAVFLTTLNLDWTALFSRETFNKNSRKNKNSAEGVHITLKDIIQSVTKDKVDHKLEYRRQILARYINERYIRHLDNAQLTYEDLVEDASRRLYEKRTELSGLASLNAPNVFIKDGKRHVKEAEIIRRLIGSEKNWLIRYLKS